MVWERFGPETRWLFLYDLFTNNENVLGLSSLFQSGTPSCISMVCATVGCPLGKALPCKSRYTRTIDLVLRPDEEGAVWPWNALGCFYMIYLPTMRIFLDSHPFFSVAFLPIFLWFDCWVPIGESLAVWESAHQSYWPCLKFSSLRLHIQVLKIPRASLNLIFFFSGTPLSMSPLRLIQPNWLKISGNPPLSPVLDQSDHWSSSTHMARYGLSFSLMWLLNNQVE